MVKLFFGKKEIKIIEGFFISSSYHQKLLNGDLILKVEGVEDLKMQKEIYCGVIFRLMNSAFSNTLNKEEVIAAILMAYPIFMKPRQFENVLSEFLKIEKNVSFKSK